MPPCNQPCWCKACARVALALGVEIHERCGVSQIVPGQPARLLNAGARVQAKAVVLATNAWSAALPRLSRLIVPVNSSIAVTEAIPQRLERIGWTGRKPSPIPN